MEKKKKIAVVYSGAKYWGGIETYLSSLFRYADKDKIELHFASMGEWPLTQKLQTTNHKLQKFSGKRMRIRTIFDIVKYLREENIDLVVSQGNVANFYARASSLISGVPSLVVVHSNLKNDYPGFFLRTAYLSVDYLTRWITKKYIAVSHYLKKGLIESGVKDKNIIVIYNGIDAKPVREKKHQGVIIGSVGRLHSVKGFDQLIEAMKYLPDKVILKIWGQGEEKVKLLQLIRTLGLGKRVKLMGHINDTSDAYGEVDIYVQPSRDEGFGLTVVEAMLAKKPVVVTPAGSLIELVEDGKTGIITKSFDAKDIAKGVKTILSDKELAEKISENGSKTAEERFSLNSWLEKTIKALTGEQQ